MSRSEALRGNRNAAGSERIAGRAAIAQALYHHFGLNIHAIAKLMGVTYEAVHHNLFDADLLPWHARKHQAEAIQKAGDLRNGIHRQG